MPPSRCHYLDEISVGADRRIVVAVVLVVRLHISAHVSRSPRGSVD